MQAGVGFTIKSGWACAVVVSGASTPRVVQHERIELSDPDVPASRQPYHDGFGTARASGPERTRLLASVKRFAQRTVGTALARVQGAGYALRGAGLVVGSLVDPDTLANDHIRIHALEGQLFRSVVHDAVTRNGLPCSIWRERDLYRIAAAVLHRPEPALRRALVAMGREAGGPWRAEHKVAALAAWIVWANAASAATTPRPAAASRAPAR